MYKEYCKFICYFFFSGFQFISLGVHLSLKPLNFEIHLPFGFIRIGLEYYGLKPMNFEIINKKSFGLKINEKDYYNYIRRF